jgi:hypothetical protein
MTHGRLAGCVGGLEARLEASSGARIGESRLRGSVVARDELEAGACQPTSLKGGVEESGGPNHNHTHLMMSPTTAWMLFGVKV